MLVPCVVIEKYFYFFAAPFCILKRTKSQIYDLGGLCMVLDIKLKLVTTEACWLGRRVLDVRRGCPYFGSWIPQNSQEQERLISP